MIPIRNRLVSTVSCCAEILVPDEGSAIASDELAGE
jgi:hypothetical protein